MFGANVDPIAAATIAWPIEEGIRGSRLPRAEEVLQVNTGAMVAWEIDAA